MRQRFMLCLALPLFVTLTLAGCQPTPPPTVTAFADPVALTSYQRNAATAQLERMDAAASARHPFSGEQPLNATYHGYHHYSINEQPSGLESQTALAGQPAAFSTEFASNQEGNTLSYYHAAGSDVIAYLLGERYQSLAKTPWVAIPFNAEATGPAPYTKPYCSIIPLRYLCTIRGAIAATAESSSAGQASPHVTLDDDGTIEIRTQVTWDSLVNNPMAAIDLPQSVLDMLPPEIHQEMVPVRLWLDDQGFPVKGEINVSFGSAPQQFQLQTGFEHQGASAESDFPTPPAQPDISVMPAEEFFAGVKQLDEESTP